MTLLLSLLGYIPGVLNLATSFTNKYFDTKVQMYCARWGVTKDVAVAAIQADAQIQAAKVGWLQAVAASPILSFVVVGFSFPFIFYLNKVIVYDICLGLGSTPALKYDLLTNWGGVIIGGIFLTSTGAGIFHAVLNKKD